MPGELDPLYVLARRALLDGLSALEPHLSSIIVIGAQAVYLHTGPADLAVAKFTTDADLAIAPEFLADRPDLGNLLEGAGFSPQQNPGMWKTADGVQLDLLDSKTPASSPAHWPRLWSDLATQVGPHDLSRRVG